MINNPQKAKIYISLQRDANRNFEGTIDADNEIRLWDSQDNNILLNGHLNDNTINLTCDKPLMNLSGKVEEASNFNLYDTDNNMEHYTGRIVWL